MNVLDTNVTFRVFDHFKWGKMKGKVNPKMFATVTIYGAFIENALGIRVPVAAIDRLKNEFKNCATQIVAVNS